MAKTTCLPAALILALAILAPPAPAQSVAPLSSRHEDWLKDEASFIITPAERDVFLKLSGDRERDLFIEAFWKQHDPTPGTARNEFREEHTRRLVFADRAFGRSIPGRGRRTEQGRIYVTLGPPLDVHKISARELYPMETWYYQGRPGFGEATFFRLLFYQPGGSGEFKLYDPSAGGPKKLVVDPLRTTDQESVKRILQEEETPRAKTPGWDALDEQAYKNLLAIAPEAAESAVSCFPGTRDPSMIPRSAILLAEIRSYPRNNGDATYLKAFLEHKATVEVSYSVHAMSNASSVQIYSDPSGLFRVHYAVVPQRISVDSYGDQFVADWKTTLRLTAPDGTTLYQEEKFVPIELYRPEIKALKNAAFHFYDSVPIVPGPSTLNVLLENTVSKEFTSISAAISLPTGKGLWMSPLLVARRAARVAPVPGGATRSFQIGEIQVDPAINGSIPIKEKTSLFFQIHNASPELQAAGIIDFAVLRDGQSVRSFRRSFSVYKDGSSVLEELPTETLEPGSYTVRVQLLDPTGKETVAGRTGFVLTDKPLLPPWIVAQPNPPVEDAYYNGVLGRQYLNRNDIEMAAQELSLARYKKPEVLEYALGYAQALLARKEFGPARAVVRKFAEKGSDSFDLYWILGQAAQGAGDAIEAIEHYQRALVLRGDVAAVLNSLGDCCLKTGDRDMAVQAWRRSLAVKADQPDLRKKLEALTK
jgi:GWxTD domain-containing protein